jgi:putative sugar O-methyltransferase
MSTGGNSLSRGRRFVPSFLRAIQGNPGIRASLRRRSLILKGRIRRLLGHGACKEHVDVYSRMQQENDRSGTLYTAGDFWKRHNRRHADAIWGGGLQNLRNEYFNRTFSGPEPESRQVYRSLLFLYYKLVKQIDKDGFLNEHQDPEIGGTSDQEIIFGRAVSLDFLQSIEEAYAIRDAWRATGRDGDPSVIVELGAGYGRLAYVCKKMMPASSYLIFDLPEALTCAQSWLSRVLGEHVLSYQQTETVAKIDRGFLSAGKVAFFLPHRIETIEDNSVDAFVNIYSFAEMPPASIENYFRHLDRITEGVFFTKQRKVEINAYDGVKISEQNYPIPKHWRKLNSSTATLYDSFFQASYATRAK